MLTPGTASVSSFRCLKITSGPAFGSPSRRARSAVKNALSVPDHQDGSGVPGEIRSRIEPVLDLAVPSDDHHLRTRWDITDPETGCDRASPLGPDRNTIGTPARRRRHQDEHERVPATFIRSLQNGPVPDRMPHTVDMRISRSVEPDMDRWPAREREGAGCPQRREPRSRANRRATMPTPAGRGDCVVVGTWGVWFAGVPWIVA